MQMCTEWPLTHYIHVQSFCVTRRECTRVLVLESTGMCMSAYIGGGSEVVGLFVCAFICRLARLLIRHQR